MRRDGIDYVECRDCGEVFEAEDLEQVSIYDDEPEGELEQNTDSAVERVRHKKAS